MMFVYGQCKGDAGVSQREYASKYPNRRTPSKDVFTNVFQKLRDTGTFPGVLDAEEHCVVRSTRSLSGVRRVRSIVQGSPTDLSLDHSERRLSSPPHDVPQMTEWKPWKQEGRL